MLLALAPLADFTDAPFRVMAMEGGADAAYTEMVSAAALAHGHNPTRILLETLPQETQARCQIFGATESDIAHAAREISLLGGRFCEINLNAGCPMRKIVRSGAGAELAKDPAKVYRLLRAMRENTPLPLTLKTRLGPDPSRPTIHELVDAAAQAGASGVIIHARYTSQCHTGPVHLDVLADAAARSPIPVIGNGSIADAQSAAAMLSTGVAGLMIGRAALADPDIFRRVKNQQEPPNATFAPQAALFRRHLELIVEFHARLSSSLPSSRIPPLDAYATLKARTHLFRYFRGLPGAAALRAAFNSVKSIDGINSILEDAQRKFR